VVLDLVVRDKKGKQVRDLDPASLDITDNGVKQKIVSFRLVDGKEALEKGATSALDPMRQVRLVTLVFERLDSESRKRARQASLDLIKGEIGQNTYYSVVTIDQKLNALQEFTNDPAKLRNAIEMATSGAFTEFAARSEAVKNQLQQTLGPADGRTTEQQIADMSNSSASGPAAGAAAAGPGVQARFAAIMLQMLSFEQSMSREQAGRSSIYSLLAIVRNQYVLPGRKTVIYFTEGLQVPPNLLSDFNSVISAANRANVSVYPIDARGLVTSSQNSGRGMLAGAAALSRAQVTNVDGAAVTGDQAKGMDTLEQGLHANVQTNLNDLAEGTGGFLVANTNDLKNPLHRINEDVNSYYEVTYKPDFENFDGSFRKIAVKSSESNVKIQARSGYFALPPTQNVTFAYEVPLLKALEAKPLPRDVEFRSGTIRFRPNGETTQCTVVVEVPMKNITFTEDKLTGTYKARVSLAVLIKNPQGTVVRKFARDLPLAGQSMMLTGVKNGNYIYTDQFAVAPGRYTLEAAILDQEGNKASARKSSFFVPKAGALSMSSLSVIRRVETGLKTTDAANPFEFKGGKVTPTLNTSLAGGKGASLSIYFVVYPDPKNAEKPKLTIEFLKDGQIVGSGSPELPAADESGRIPYLATSSAESMPPGMYEVKARVKQGAAVVEESRTFTVEQQ
jgi:VWFA-related protein